MRITKIIRAAYPDNHYAYAAPAETLVPDHLF